MKNAPQALALAALAILSQAPSAQRSERRHDDVGTTPRQAVEALLAGDARATTTEVVRVYWNRATGNVGTAPRLTGNVGTAPRSFVVSPNLEGAGASVEVEGVLELVVVPPTTILSNSSTGSTWAATVGGSGDVMTLSWEWEDPVTGTRRTITVSYERRKGQSSARALAEFQALVAQNLAWYPPNVTHSSSRISGSGLFFEGGQGAIDARGSTPWREPGAQSRNVKPTVDDTNVMSVSWKHDPDGPGPLKPVTVTASTERRPSESVGTTAKRLGKMAKALMDIFPPNVLEEVSSTSARWRMRAA